MKFLYKIYSNFDGFTPSKIPVRTIDDGKRLKLGWRRYIDSVSKNDECWVYFHGPHSFQNGVYVKGSVSEIDNDNREVILTVKQFDTTSPLTDQDTSARVAEIVAIQGRQVFVWPDSAEIAQQCSLSACTDRLCGACNRWSEFMIINRAHLIPTVKNPVPVERFIPAYWTIPSRCFLWRYGPYPALHIQRLTHMFNSYKVGAKAYAYPLALGMYHALRDATDSRFDAIVPIPLSPDKSEAGELHRTLKLARELGRLSNSPVRELLSLTAPISKRAMINAGHTKSQFEQRYFSLLEVSDGIQTANRILLLDDVCTRGSTLTQAYKKLVEAKPDLEIWLSTAGQMIIKAAVADDSGFS